MTKAQAAGALVFAGLVALCVALGVTAGNAWVGLLVFAGAILLQVAFNQAVAHDAESSVGIAWLGVGGIYWGGQIARYSAGWLWSVPWGLAVLLLLGAAAATIGKTRLVSFGMLMLAGLGTVMGVLGPLALVGLDDAAMQEVTRQWWWTWLLLIGVATLAEAAWEARDDEPAVYLALAAAGIGILAIGSWIGRDASPWVTAPAWMVGAVLAGHGAWRIREDSPAVGWAMLLVSAAGLAAAVAVAVPILLPGRDGGASGTGIALPDLAAWLPVAASALGETVRSGWGLLYLAVAFVAGTIWSRRWGGIAALLALIAAIGVFGVAAGGPDLRDGRASALLTGSPATLVRELLATAGRSFGSPGWGSLLLGAVFALAMVPAVLRSVATQLDARASDRRTTAIALAHPALLFGLMASTWMGLRELAASAGSTSFLFVPDIALPSFWPVWDPSYALVGLAVGLVTVANQRIYQRVGLPTDGQGGRDAAWLGGSIALGLVVPAGVLLLLLSHNVVVGTATALAGRRLAAEARRRRQARMRRPADEAAADAFLRMLLQGQMPEPPAPGPSRPAPRPKPKPVGPTPRPAPPKPKPAPPALRPEPTTLADGTRLDQGGIGGNVGPWAKPPMPKPGDLGGATVLAGGTAGGIIPDAGATALAGDGGLLYRSPEPLVDLLRLGGSEHLMLRQDGHVARWAGRGIEVIPGILLEQPIGLAAGKDGLAIAADGAKRFLGLRLPDGARPETREHPVDLTIGCFAVNPFGTIAAYAPVRRPAVLAVLLATGARQTLAEDVAGVTAMAFSTDGRNLALGLRDGRVRLLDMSTRRMAPDLVPPPGERGRVVALAQCPDRGWVAACQAGRLVRWDAAGALVAARDAGHRLSSLAVCGESGRVAAGSADGHVLVHPAGLDRLELDANGHADAVVRAWFEAGGGTLVSAGRDGTVRRTAM